MPASQPWPPGPTHARLLLQEARRLSAFHAMLVMAGLSDVTWFVIDLRSPLGLRTGVNLLGPRVAAHRLRSAASRGIPASVPFPLDFPDALLIVEQLAPECVEHVRRRLPGDVPVVVLDHLDIAALFWLRELEALWGRA